MSALSAHDVVYDMSAGRHIAVCRIAMSDVYDIIEEESFAMLATKILQQSAYAGEEYCTAVLY